MNARQCYVIRTLPVLFLLARVTCTWRCVCSISSVLLTGENRSARRKTYPSATLSATETGLLSDRYFSCFRMRCLQPFHELWVWETYCTAFAGASSWQTKVKLSLCTPWGQWLIHGRHTWILLVSLAKATLNTNLPSFDAIGYWLFWPDTNKVWIYVVRLSQNCSWASFSYWVIDSDVLRRRTRLILKVKKLSRYRPEQAHGDPVG